MTRCQRTGLTTRRAAGSVLVAALLLTGPVTQPATAQPALRLNTYVSYTDNLFQNYSARADWVSLTYFDLDVQVGQNTALYYSGNASVFSDYRDLFSHRHQVGLSHVRPTARRGAVYAGLALSALVDRPVYDYYDYVEAEAYVSGKGYGPMAVMGRLGGEARYRAYPNAGDYSYVEYSGYGLLQRSWQTGTTVNVRAGIAAKRFLNEASFDTSDVRARLTGERTLAQVTGSAKVAQALGPQTGLQLVCTWRTNLAGQGRSVAFETYFEDLLDDHYAHTGTDLRAVLKHVAVGGFRLEATGRTAWRTYEDRPALDLEGYLIGDGVWREDRRHSLHLEGEKVIYTGAGWPRQVGVRAEWLYQRVDSNDPYYDAATRVYSVGLEIGF